MAEAFRRVRGRKIATATESFERTMLRRLLDELSEMLDSDNVADSEELDPLARELGLVDLAGGEVAPPTDPILLRLLPDGYPGDMAASAEFRRFTDGSLRAGKMRDADTVRAGLDRGDAHDRGKIVLTEPEAAAWARAINDVRLALGVRLDLTSDEYPDPSSMDEDDPHVVPAVLYDFLTWWQDSLVKAMMPKA